MLGEGRRLLFTAPHVSIIPGLMIFLLVMSINLSATASATCSTRGCKSGALARPSSRPRVDRRTCRRCRGAAGERACSTSRDLKTEFRIGKAVYRAVGGVDLVLGKGECLGLVGESARASR
jgi:peptide/nickel transport system permease protein